MLKIKSQPPQSFQLSKFSMYQIRIHGRGGQGVVTAAELIAIAAFKDGKQAQAFPSFGVERTGAPVEAYVRIDNHPIRIHEQIYHPDCLIVQDASLIGSINLTGGCDDRAIIIVNTAQEKKGLNLGLPEQNIFCVDATKIALKIIGKNIVNTVILGAFAKVSKLITIKSLESAIKEKFAEKPEIIEKNTKAIKEAYNK